MAECEETRRADEVWAALRELQSRGTAIVLAEVRAISARANQTPTFGIANQAGVSDARSLACLALGQLAEALHRGTFVDLGGRLGRAIKLAEAWKLAAEQAPTSLP
jgi:hypothetical protein